MIERVLAVLEASAKEPGRHKEKDLLLAERLRARALMWSDFGQVLAIAEELAWGDRMEYYGLN